MTFLFRVREKCVRSCEYIKLRLPPSWVLFFVSLRLQSTNLASGCDYQRRNDPFFLQPGKATSAEHSGQWFTTSQYLLLKGAISFLSVSKLPAAAAAAAVGRLNSSRTTRILDSVKKGIPFLNCFVHSKSAFLKMMRKNKCKGDACRPCCCSLLFPHEHLQQRQRVMLSALTQFLPRLQRSCLISEAQSQKAAVLRGRGWAWGKGMWNSGLAYF